MGLEYGFFIAAIFVSIYAAWNMGGNDLANAMATSVSSKALTLRKAVILAGILNGIGAIFVGGHVTETVSKGIVDPMAFSGEPKAFVIGMFSALLAAAIWVQIATHLGMPISTTHSIVGAVAGFGVVAKGIDAVSWTKMGTIALSWVVSPVFSAALGFLIFTLVQKKIINAPSPSRAVKQYGPYLVFCVIALISLSMIYKGLKNLHLDFPLWQAIGLSVGAGLIAVLVIKNSLKRMPESHESLHEEFVSMENVFRHLQVISAAYMAFAHGANDVGNAIAPLAAIYSVMKTGSVSLTVAVPPWILILGGLAMGIGTATFGYKVMATLGHKITEMTSSRGFSAEFSSATTVLVASKLGMPISTTHSIVGAVIGVGLARGLGALNLRMINSIIKSWLLTLPFTIGLTVVIYIVLYRFYG